MGRPIKYPKDPLEDDKSIGMPLSGETTFAQSVPKVLMLTNNWRLMFVKPDIMNETGCANCVTNDFYY